MVPKSKPGWKTSEFWLSMLGMVAGMAQTVAAPNTGVAIGGAIVTAALGAAYNGSRAYTKGQVANAQSIASQQ